MKRIYILVLTVLMMISGVRGQQDAHYSQYMFNGQVLNPAFCGSLDHLTGTLLIREQWLGLSGRPRTQTLGLNAPTRNQKHGIGGTLINDKTGATGTTRLTGQYAYRIMIRENIRIALGVQGSLYNYRSKVLGLRSEDPSDPFIPGNDVNLWRPNVGTGIYFNTNRYYAGLSVPELLENRLTKTAGSKTREDRNYIGTAGVVLRLSRGVYAKPSVMVRYNPSLPVSLDLNAMFLFREKFWAGVSYRWDDAIVALLDLQVSPAIRLGYAYDLTISELGGYTTGSHEFMLGYDLSFKKKESVSPRFFH